MGRCSSDQIFVWGLLKGNIKYFQLKGTSGNFKVFSRIIKKKMLWSQQKVEGGGCDT